MWKRAGGRRGRGVAFSKEVQRIQASLWDRVAMSAGGVCGLQSSVESVDAVFPPVYVYEIVKRWRKDSWGRLRDILFLVCLDWRVSSIGSAWEWRGRLSSAFESGEAALESTRIHRSGKKEKGSVPLPGTG